MKKQIIGICGPTASGKTAVAVELALLINGEIISADSMQIYKGMDILSAKPTAEEMKGVPHHLLGFLDPKQSFSASAFREAAEEKLKDIEARGKTPILCGGTGLYIDALTRGMKLAEMADEKLRNTLKAEAEAPGGAERLHARLKALDPEAAERYPAADVRRVIRSIEINLLTGKTRREMELIDAQTPEAYSAKLFAIDWDRRELYNRIDRRVDDMLKAGLINEVSELIKADSNGHPTAIQAIGYKEIAAGLRGELAMSDAIIKLKTASRNLAKRQLTWFKRDTRVTWLKAEGKTAAELAKEIYSIAGEII